MPKLTVPFQDTEAEVVFDYSRGEHAWFNAKAGVGGPAIPAIIDFESIKVNGGFLLIQDIPDEDLDLLDDRIREAWEDKLMAEQDAACEREHDDDR